MQKLSAHSTGAELLPSRPILSSAAGLKRLVCVQARAGVSAAVMVRRIWTLLFDEAGISYSRAACPDPAEPTDPD